MGNAEAEIVRLPGEPPSPWETRFGFSRVVKAGPFVMIGGTTSADAIGCVIGETVREQTLEIVRKLHGNLARAGCTFGDVVSAHAYLTDIALADVVGMTLAAGLLTAKPLLTMVEVAGLIDPRMLIEIELTAYKP